MQKLKKSLPNQNKPVLELAGRRSSASAGKTLQWIVSRIRFAKAGRCFSKPFFLVSKTSRWCARNCVSSCSNPTRTASDCAQRRHNADHRGSPTQRMTDDNVTKLPNSPPAAAPRWSRVECDDDRARPSRPVGPSQTECDVRQFEGRATARCSTFTMRRRSETQHAHSCCLPSRETAVHSPSALPWLHFPLFRPPFRETNYSWR